MSKPTTLDNIYERYKKEAGDLRITKLECIKDLNDLLFQIPITKPAERIQKIYYVDGFYNYQAPDDMRDVIAIYADSVKIIRYVSYFRWKLEEPIISFTDQVNKGKRFLKIRNSYTDSVATLVTECDSLTEDGTWAATGGASTPTIDTNTKESGSGSISFNMSASTQGILTFTKTVVIDASSYTEFMRLRCNIWLPTLPSSIKVRVGNDASNYFEQTITTQANGEVFSASDVNEIEFAENSATETGTVTKSTIDWFQFEFNFASATTDTQFRIDKIVLAKPEIMDLEYYTNYVAITSAGILQDKITESDSTDDEPIIKDYPDYINVIINGLAAGHLQNKAPERAELYYKKFIAEEYNGKLIGGIKFLEDRYPSRRAAYKRIKTLPDLYRGNLRQGKYV